MVIPSLQPLCELSAVHIAYLMWCRHDLITESYKRVLSDELVGVVLSEVQSLNLPKRVKPFISYNVKPVGRRLLVLLTLWLRKTKPNDSGNHLTMDMFYECLEVNADGLINYSKTAEKMLHSGTLDSTVAFRLASINYLEAEVLKLWPSVKHYFLNKIVQESERPGTSDEEMEEPDDEMVRNSLSETPGRRDYSTVFSNIKEPCEVLYWIGYCLSKENAVTMDEVPHFSGDNDWLGFSLASAAHYGNISRFEHFEKSRVITMKYDYMWIMEKLFKSKDEDNQQPCFVFIFKRLDSEEKARLFQQFPRETISQFLQWPLSVTFRDNAEEVWNFIPDSHKDWVFIKIFTILFQKSSMLLYTRLTIMHYLGLTKKMPGIVTGIYNTDHLRSIWSTLWEISPNDYKLHVLELFVFSGLVLCSPKPYAFITCFESSGLKSKLLDFFNSDGSYILKLYEGKNLKESLRTLIAKHMPNDYKYLYGHLISRITPKARGHFVRMKTLLQLRTRSAKMSRSTPVHQDFVRYVHNCLSPPIDIDEAF
ncbi:hypothetical protein HNY73_009364 [Argiope bruennichi]|uniref:Uncharacterized protein n=1 Tax=Argiope bruennichi TaxID=94029 RepID=A0A8T0FBT3_ARGBR|nr:hypothetical protein HNY73_009364 [Argiope bruennichi]